MSYFKSRITFFVFLGYLYFYIIFIIKSLPPVTMYSDLLIVATARICRSFLSLTTSYLCSSLMYSFLFTIVSLIIFRNAVTSVLYSGNFFSIVLIVSSIASSEVMKVTLLLFRSRSCSFPLKTIPDTRILASRKILIPSISLLVFLLTFYVILFL